MKAAIRALHAITKTLSVLLVCIGFSSTYADEQKPGDVSPSYKITNRVEPQYPVKALAYGVDAEITLRIFLNSECQFVRSKLVASSTKQYSDAFEEAAMSAVKQWQYECKDKSYQGHEIQQNFSFKSGVKIIGDQLPDTTLLLKNIVIKTPDYPRKALVEGIEAIVIVRIPVSKDCEVGVAHYLAIVAAKERSRKIIIDENSKQLFRDSINEAVKKWGVNKPCNLQEAVMIEQPFMFKTNPPAVTRYEQTSRLSIGTFLGLFNKNENFRQRISNRDGVCPTMIAFSPLMPYENNRIDIITGDSKMPITNIKDGIKILQTRTSALSLETMIWLQNLELEDKYKLSFIGEKLVVDIPCTDIDMR